MKTINSHQDFAASRLRGQLLANVKEGIEQQGRKGPAIAIPVRRRPDLMSSRARG
jgi:hypothetical protein